MLAADERTFIETVIGAVLTGVGAIVVTQVLLFARHKTPTGQRETMMQLTERATVLLGQTMDHYRDQVAELEKLLDQSRRENERLRGQLRLRNGKSEPHQRE